jgi:hypothetical protein
MAIATRLEEMIDIGSTQLRLVASDEDRQPSYLKRA